MRRPDRHVGAVLAVLVLALPIVPGASSLAPRASGPVRVGPSMDLTPAHPTPARPTQAAAPVWVNLSVLQKTQPPDRGNYGLAYDPVDRYVVLFGGLGIVAGVGTNFNDTWVWSNGTWTNLTATAGTAPSPRYDLSMAWDAADGYIVLFGGSPGTNIGSNDTWTFLHGKWTALNLAVAPSQRYEAPLEYDPVLGELILFGGSDGGGGTYYNDTWAFHGGSWTQLVVSGSHAPSPRRAPAEAYDVADGYLLLFGGTDASFSALGDTWSFQNGTWTQLAPSSSPPGRWLAGSDYDPRLHEMVINGGSGTQGCGTIFGDTWTYAGGNWTRWTGTTGSPPWHCAAPMAYGPDGSGDLFFGGTNATNGLSDSAWGFTDALLAELHVPAVADVGETISLTVTSVGGGLPRTYVYAGLPTGCAPANASPLACVPSANGTFSPTVQVTDPAGRSANASANLTILPAINVTLAESAPAIDLGQYVVLTAAASGGAGGNHWRYSGLPPGCPTADSARLNCTPTTSGSFAVRATANDSVGGSGVSAPVTFTVGARPALRLILSPAVDDAGLPEVLSANWTGGSPPVSYGWSGLPTGCSNSDTPVLRCTPGATGNYSISVVGTDSVGGTRQVTALLRVVPRLAISAFRSTVSSVDAGVPFGLFVTVTGGSAPLRIAYLGLPTGCAPGNDSSLNCSAPTPGNLALRVVVADPANGSAEAFLNVSVTSDPSIATFTASPATIDLGGGTRFAVTAQGGQGVYSYRFNGLPPGCTTANRSVLTCAPSTTGAFQVTAVVADPQTGAGTASVSIQVNRALTVRGLAASPGVVPVHGTANLSVEAVGGTPPLSYSWSGLPAGCGDADSPILSCTPSGAGRYPINVTVTDAANGSASAGVVLEVLAQSPTSAPPGGVVMPWEILVAVVGAVAIVTGLLLGRRSRRGSTPEEGPSSSDETSVPAEPDPPDDPAMVDSS